MRPDCVQLVHQVQHIAGGTRVEVAGGLVGQDQVGLGDQRPGHGHPLLLPTGQLAGTVLHPPGQTHLGQRGHGPLLALAAAHAGVDERQLHVLPGRHGGQEVELLEDEADAPVAHLGQLGLAHAGHVLTGQGVGAGRWRIEAAEDVHQGGLARSRWPDDGHVLALVDGAG